MIWVPVILLLLFYAYVIYAGVKRVWSQLSFIQKSFFLPIALFYPVDILFNWTLGSLLFLEAPKELTLSERCERHIQGHNFLRKRIANQVCLLLNIFEPNHCENKL